MSDQTAAELGMNFGQDNVALAENTRDRISKTLKNWREADRNINETRGKMIQEHWEYVANTAEDTLDQLNIGNIQGTELTIDLATDHSFESRGELIEFLSYKLWRSKESLSWNDPNRIGYDNPRYLQSQKQFEDIKDIVNPIFQHVVCTSKPVEKEILETIFLVSELTTQKKKRKKHYLILLSSRKSTIELNLLNMHLIIKN